MHRALYLTALNYSLVRIKIISMQLKTFKQYLLNHFLNSYSASFKNHHSAVAQEIRVTQLRAEIIAPVSKICRELNTAMSTVVSTAHVISSAFSRGSDSSGQFLLNQFMGRSNNFWSRLELV